MLFLMYRICSCFLMIHHSVLVVILKTREFFSRRRMLFDLEMDGELNVAAVFFKRALYASGVIK